MSNDEYFEEEDYGYGRKLSDDMVKGFISFISSLFSKFFKYLWERHMISIYDYFDRWKEWWYNDNFVIRVIKSIKHSMRWRGLSFKQRAYRIINLLSNGYLVSLSSNPPDPKIPLFLEGTFYLCHFFIFIALFMFAMKIGKLTDKFDKRDKEDAEYLRKMGYNNMDGLNNMNNNMNK
tara:strand:- start:1580 stop:2110 length:531 start_codon:yes stop_codon:yes gene_type:complete